MPNADYALESRNERLAQLFRFLTDDQLADVLAWADGDENLDKKVSAAFRRALDTSKLSKLLRKRSYQPSEGWPAMAAAVTLIAPW